VIGGLFNGTSRPKSHTVADKKHVTRRITSRLGHAIEMSDGAEPAAQHIALSLAGEEHALRLGKDKVDLQVPAGVPLTIAVGDARISVDGSGSITLKGVKVSVEGTQAVSIKAPKVDIRADNALALAGLTAELKGSTTAKVEGGASLALKGGTVQIN